MALDVSTLNQFGILGFWRWNFHSDRIETCKGLNHLFGFPSSGDWLEQSTTAYLPRIHPEDRAWLLDVQRRCLGPSGIGLLEFRVIDRSGDVHWVESRGSYRADSNGGLHSGAGVLLDVTGMRSEGYHREVSAASIVDPLASLADSLLSAHVSASELADPSVIEQVENLLYNVGCLLAARVSKRDALRLH